ncbi:MAG: GNAT family N-acetyltransferase [Peptoniphilus sp.]|nr:GNAT family N-acetyltransferase [Peptoniphilus sp.]MDD7363113.1 GNAT family N-acetyltransferase [Bacillota bacterium]MDY6044365.1 GNAT family N-acetyltransferase [Peptoniphilus sp.]
MNRGEIKEAYLTMRTANLGDAPSIIRMIDEARARLKKDGVDQWQGADPTEEEILVDIRGKNTYLFEREGIVATAVLAEGDEPTYRYIDGSWPDDEPYMTVHRFVVAKNCLGRGMGRRVMRQIKDFAVSRAVDVRIDTHADNARMRHVIETSGFEYCGVITVADGTERIAYQWRRI